jgi:Flp pilus assembly protein TadG
MEMTLKHILNHARREDGAAAVEFALIAGVLVLLIFGMLQFGLAFWQVQNLRSATREAARVAAVRADNATIGQRLVAASNSSLPTGYSGYTVQTGGTSGVCTKDTSGDEVVVRITNSSLPASVKDAFSIDIPFMPTFTINPDLSGTFRCE